jgi:hypothetical protein
MVTEKEFIQASRKEGYSEEIIQKALQSKWLSNITVTYTETGEIDIPQRDWSNALSDASGKPVSVWMWD